MGLLADANPVSDPNTFALDMGGAARLRTIEQGTKTMTETELHSIEPPTAGRSRRDWLVAAAAAAVILIVGIGTGVMVGQNLDESPTDSAATTSATSMTPAETIEAYVAAYNVGDIDAVMDLFVEDSVVSGHPGGSGEERGLVAIRELHGPLDDGDTYAISITNVTGNTVTWDHIWVAFEDGEPFSNCVDGHTAVIQDGKILSWTWPTTDFNCP
jgi:hypothetical protein